MYLENDFPFGHRFFSVKAKSLLWVEDNVEVIYFREAILSKPLEERLPVTLGIVPRGRSCINVNDQPPTVLTYLEAPCVLGQL